MADLKATSFRLNEEDIEKFKAFMEQEGIKTQADGFKSIMQTVEMAQAKGQIKDRAKEIDLFQDTINRLMGYYLNSLEVNQNSEERIREELNKELNTKDSTITNLQDQLKDLREDNKTLKDKSKTLDNNNKELQQQLQKLQEDLSDKQRSMAKLNANNDLLQEQLAEYKKYKEEYNKLNQSYQEQIDKSQEQLTTLQQTHKEDINKLQESYQEKIDKLQEQLTNSNQSIMNKDNTIIQLQGKLDLSNERVQFYKVNSDKLEASHKEQLEQNKKDIENQCKLNYNNEILKRNEKIRELINIKEQLEMKLKTSKATASTKE